MLVRTTFVLGSNRCVPLLVSFRERLAIKTVQGYLPYSSYFSIAFHDFFGRLTIGKTLAVFGIEPSSLAHHLYHSAVHDIPTPIQMVRYSRFSTMFQRLQHYFYLDH